MYIIMGNQCNLHHVKSVLSKLRVKSINLRSVKAESLTGVSYLQP